MKLQKFGLILSALAMTLSLLIGCAGVKNVNAGDGMSIHESSGPPTGSMRMPAPSVDGALFTDRKPDGSIRWERFVPASELMPLADRAADMGDAYPTRFATVMTAGKNHALETEFRGGTAVTTWYIGLISSSGYSAISAADTLASHSGWTEGTPYSGNRPAWTPGAASSGATTNGSAVAFTINATLTVKGMFLASANSGTSGTLMSAALFSGGDASVISGDTLNVTYTFTLTLLDTATPRGFPFLTPVRLMNPALYVRKEEFARIG